jgi:hypothetical protein
MGDACGGCTVSLAWATVKQISPLTVRMDGATADSNALSLRRITHAVNDRVIVDTVGAQLVVLGSPGHDYFLFATWSQSVAASSSANVQTASFTKTTEISDYANPWSTAAGNLTFTCPEAGLWTVHFDAFRSTAGASGPDSQIVWNGVGAVNNTNAGTRSTGGSQVTMDSFQMALNDTLIFQTYNTRAATEILHGYITARRG